MENTEILNNKTENTSCENVEETNIKTSKKYEDLDIQKILMETIHEVNKNKETPEQKQKKWDRRYIELAKMVGSWSSCARPDRQVGSVIVRNKRIIATGYNGAPSGIMSCRERGYCLRDKLGIKSGTRAEVCFSTHSEQSALMQAAKMGVEVDGATIYVTHRPCVICTKLIINAGIERIVYAYNYPDEFSVEMLRQAGIELVHLPDEKK